MKTYKTLKITVLIIGLFVIAIACSSTEKSTYTKMDSNNIVYTKSGAQLWGENCIRCHSIPSPSSYNDTDWETIGLHMKVRANLTSVESKKIFGFLKSAN